MNIDKPHDIIDIEPHELISLEDLKSEFDLAGMRGQPPKLRAKYRLLKKAEADMLRRMTIEERGQWLVDNPLSSSDVERVNRAEAKRLRKAAKRAALGVKS